MKKTSQGTCEGGASTASAGPGYWWRTLHGIHLRFWGESAKDHRPVQQVLFLLYHYFEAKELYNGIRVLIAAYVWMTGFGNFLYYYKTRDFSVGRFAEMMWRLNFLVFFCCLVLNNSYMLYYICPMHTLFTVLVYAVLALFPDLNNNKLYLFGKIVASVGIVYLVWEIKPVFYALWRPFGSLVTYNDPRRPGNDDMHEW